MYRNPAQWSKVRHRVLVLGHSIRELSRSEGMSRNTIKKILKHPKPQPYVRPTRTSIVNHYQDVVADMLLANERRNPRDRYTIADIFRHIRDTHGFSGSYSSVHRSCRSLLNPKVTLAIRASIGRSKIADVTFLRASKRYRLRTEVEPNPANISIQLIHTRHSRQTQEAEQWVESLRRGKLPLQPCDDAEAQRALLVGVNAPKQRQRNRAISALMHDPAFAR